MDVERPSWAGMAHAAVWLGAAGGVVTTAAGFAGALWWGFDLFSHFRVQYAVGALVVGLAALALRRRYCAALAAVVALANAAAIAPEVLATRPAASRAGTELRVLLLNVHTSNTQHARVARLIEQADADVVALLEVDRRWMEALEPIWISYPTRRSAPRSDNFGIAFASRLPARSIEVRELAGQGLPIVVAELDAPGGPVTAIAVHPPPPVSTDLAYGHERMMIELAALARAAGPRVIVLGDLNASPWTHRFRALLEAGDLRDSRRGFGLQTTFPADGWLLRIPIDHVLVGRALTVTDRRVGPAVGADHLPVRATLRLASPAE